MDGLKAFLDRWWKALNKQYSREASLVLSSSHSQPFSALGFETSTQIICSVDGLLLTLYSQGYNYGFLAPLWGRAERLKSESSLSNSLNFTWYKCCHVHKVVREEEEKAEPHQLGDSWGSGLDITWGFFVYVSSCQCLDGKVDIFLEHFMWNTCISSVSAVLLCWMLNVWELILWLGAFM